jgi:hypothetical protein
VDSIRTRTRHDTTGTGRAVDDNCGADDCGRAHDRCADDGAPNDRADDRSTDDRRTDDNRGAHDDNRTGSC